MRKLLIVSALGLSLILAGCGINTSVIGNLSNSETAIELSRKNFKVLDKVTGQSEHVYIFGIGGMKNKSLIENAKNQMMNNANLKDGSRAVINITYDTHLTLIFPFVVRHTITASGYVIEFTE